ncbi:MAG: site-2 protease family protein [Dongiaceae bacterium]
MLGGYDLPGLIHEATTWVLPVLIAITLHEAAHGFVAWRCGDNTAYMLGRVSFNPLRHVDPFGTVILPALLMLSGTGFLFGYAKPVPVNFRNLRNPRRDMVLVAAAGPGINLILAVIAALLIHIAVLLPDAAGQFATETLFKAMLLNVWLAMFNMLPLPPLDGGRVAVGLLPRALAMPLARLERHGMLILIALIFLLPLIGRSLGMNLNILSWILGPASSYVLDVIARITGIMSILGPQ